MEFLLKFLYVIRNPVVNNNNGIANCILYLTKNSNQHEDGTHLEPKTFVEIRV